MSKIVYEVLPHDHGWAYRADGTYSEPFPTRAAALAAARRAAAEQRSAGETTPISYEDAEGLWHDEVADGQDRPEVDVNG